jgi:uncharacterized membrane protein YgdD (TMEM256/DUF423 family)
MEEALIALAGLMGAAGIVLVAAGAHGKPGVGLDSAGYLLLVHAATLISGCALLRFGIASRLLISIALWGFVFGACLFAADVSARAYIGSRLFPFAAPAGGTILILAWLTLAVTAFFTGSRPG